MLKSLDTLVDKVVSELKSPPMRLTENVKVSNELDYHLKNKMTLSENVFRSYSDKFFSLINEVRWLYNNDKIRLNKDDIWIIESNIGEKSLLDNGKEVYLDVPFEVNMVNEAEYQGRKVQVGKPMRNSGGGKKYVVYVRNPSTGKIKKISFGDVHGGLTAKVSNPKARKSFASRHQCDKKKDRMTAGYWACRINRYGHLWGGKTYSGYW
jgi:hypothetical protein